MAKTKEQAAEVEKVAPIKYNECPLLAHGNPVFSARVKNYHSRSQLEDPGLWVNVAQKLEMFSRVEVYAIDGSMFARCFVQYVKGSQAKVKCLDHYDLDRVAQDEVRLAGHIIRNLGKADGWTISLESTGELVKDRMPDQASCVNYLQDQEKAA